MECRRCICTKPNRTPAEDVRYWRKSGRHLLVLSISQFDPERKSRLFSGVICLLIVNPCLMDCTERAILTARTLEGGTGGNRFFHRAPNTAPPKIRIACAASGSEKGRSALERAPDHPEGNVVPNMGKPLTDASFVASSSMTSQ